MFRILFFAIAALILCRMLLWLADRSWRAIAFPLRIWVGLTALAMAFIGFAFIANDDNPPVSFLVSGLILVALAAHVMWRLAFRRWRPSPASVSFAGSVSVPPTATWHDSEHWAPLLSSLGWRQRSRGTQAHARIKRFLAEAEAHGTEERDRDLAIALKRRVPELLAEWQRRCIQASVEERDTYSARTLAILESLASEADQARADLRRDGDRTFDTLERYFTRFTEKGRRPD